VRADEEYGFQQATGIADFSGLIGSGRQEEDAAVLNLDLPPLNGNDLWNSRFRSVTKKCYNGTDQIEPTPQYWTIFWPRCQSENKKITINWPSLNIPGLVKFQLLRDGAVLAQPDPASAKFIDSADLICGSIYTYRFRTEVALPGGGLMIFLSPEVKASAISNRPPDPVQNITASVLSSVMEIKAEPSPIARLYHLFRKESEGGSYAEIGNGFSSLPIKDETASPNEKAYCYRISFDDVCGNRSLLSDVICPILLKVEKEEGGSLSFDWTALEGWKNGGVLRYELLLRKAAQPFEETIAYRGKNLSFEQEGQIKDSKKLIFRVRALPESPALYPDTSFSNEVEIIQESRFRFPDSFTPNNDRMNDEFKCYGSFIKTYQLIIYNSWGNVVFSSDKPDAGWDGKIDDVPAQTGNYAYRAIATDESGERMEKAGFFSLLR
jgi:gliding motility-associated-like protein